MQKRKISVFLLAIFLAFSCLFICSCTKENKKSSYTIQVKYLDGIIDGKLAYKFVNSYNSPFDCLKFNLYTNAYDENSSRKPVTQTNQSKAYPYGESYGQITINSVLLKDEKIPFETYGENNEFLKISTGTIPIGKEVEVEIDFTTQIPKSILRLGETEDQINLADFFPVACKVERGDFKEISYSTMGDPYFSNDCDYFVSLTLPSTFTVASSGFPTQTNCEGNFTTYEYELLSGRDFVFSLSQNYNVFSKNENGVTVNYYTTEKSGDSQLALILDCVKFFTNTLGKIPYKSLSVVKSKYYYSGMEYSGLCMVSDELNEEESKLAIIHEVAHQWFFGGVGSNQIEEPYIDEGLCEYLTYLYLSESEGESKASEMISTAKSAYKSFFSIENLLSGKLETKMNKSIYDYKSEYEYVNLAYNKSLIAFYEYHKAVGKKVAISKLKKLYSKYKGSTIGYNELVQIFGHEEHFKSFVEGTVLI